MKKPIIIVSITAILAFCIIPAIGYTLISNHQHKAYYRGIFEEVTEYIENDTYFEQTYGKVVAFEYHEDQEYQIIGDRTSRIPCYVEVSNGDVYLVWIDWYMSTTEEEDVFTYHSVTLQP